VDPAKGALDTDDGRALAREVTELLEAELVRFTHRVDHDHGIELDRARGALAVITTLLRGGVAWTTRADCAPGRIADAFTAIATRDGAEAALVEQLRGEIDAFVEAAADVVVVDRPARTVADLLRAAGAAPETWWWAAEYGTDRDRCWKASGAASERLVQVAIALGIAGERVLCALAGAFTVAATRVKTSRTAQRNDLVALLGRLASTGAAAIARDRELVAKATALAFEMAAAQQPWWTAAAAGPRERARRSAPDGIAEIAVLSFQLVELFGAAAAGRRPDPERYGELAYRADRTLAGRGLRLAAMVQKELEAAYGESKPGGAVNRRSDTVADE
jgi:hypothetical protein